MCSEKEILLLFVSREIGINRRSVVKAANLKHTCSLLFLYSIDPTEYSYFYPLLPNFQYQLKSGFYLDTTFLMIHFFTNSSPITTTTFENLANVVPKKTSCQDRSQDDRYIHGFAKFLASDSMKILAILAPILT